MQSEALETAQIYEKLAIDRLRRMGISAADLEFKGARKMPGHHSSAGNFFSAADLGVDEFAIT